MSLKFVLAFCAAITANAGDPPQIRIDVAFAGEKVEAVLEYITEITECQFIYRDGLLENMVVGEINMKDATIPQVLDELLGPHGLKYEMEGAVVVIRRPHEAPNQAEITVRGKVVGTDGQPLAGAAVTVSAAGVSTDANGDFVLNLPSATPAFEVRYLGMFPQTISIGTQREFLITMLEQTMKVEEVVLTGIFSKARESYTGAAATVTGEQLRLSGNHNLLTILQSVEPSFRLTENINTGSDPNAIPDVTIRGRASMTNDISGIRNDSRNLSNTPLFILDGFEIGVERMMDLDQNRIESVTILKDASAAAMYGTRGANGVVVITSLRPRAGKLLITYRGGLDIEAPDLGAYNLLNAKEKLEYERAAGLYVTVGVERQALSLLELYNARCIEVGRGVDTYWLKYPVRVGVGHNHSLTIEGDESDWRYSASLSYRDIAGSMKGSGRRIFNGGIYLAYRHKKASFSNDLRVSHTKATNSPYGSFSEYANVNAYWKPYDDDGNIIMFLDDRDYTSISGSEGISLIANPLYNALLPGIDERKYTGITDNFMVEWHPLPELAFRGRLGVMWQNGRSDRYKSAKHTDFASYTGDDYKRRGRYTMGWDELFEYAANLNVSYNKVFGDRHMFFAGLDFNAEEDADESYEIVGEGITNDKAGFLSLAALYEQGGSPSGTEGISRRAGAIFSVNYTYDLRYFVDVSGTVEGASRFGAKRRTAPFWAVGAGWNLHHERFMADATLNTARLRVSYGTTGAQNFDPYMAMRTFRYYGTDNYNGMTGAYIVNIGNPDLGWQKTSQLNAGFDIELFRGRIRASVDLYDKLTDDMLADITLPSSSGFNSYKANVGKVSNRGIETGVNFGIVRDADRKMLLNVGGALVYNRNEIREISNSLEFLNKTLLSDGSSANLNPSFLYKEGHSMNTIFAVRSLGIDPSTGREIFLKADGRQTYIWDASDKMPCGVADPLFQGTATVFFRFGAFSLNAIFGYHWGGQAYNATLANKVENNLPYRNADKRVLYDRWKEPGDLAKYKSVTDRSSTKATTRFVADDNVFKFRNVVLSYEFTGEWLTRNLSVSYLGVSVYGEDLFYLSSIKRERGIDYPYSRKFSFTVTARF